MSKTKLYILSRGVTQEVAVKEPISWDLQRKSTPGKLSFTVLNDEDLNFFEGDAVRFDYDGKKVFYGFVFTKKRSNNTEIQVTAYDQLRYLKNKDTITYKGINAGGLIKQIAKDFRIQTGYITDPGYTLPSTVEDNSELFNMIEDALAKTTRNTGKYFVMYDDYGKLTLREVSDLKVNILIDEESAQSFDYTSSIDEKTYNKIKITRENKDKKTREIFIAQSSDSFNNWGVLQLLEKADEGENAKTKADALLELYNRKTRKLNINKVFGDIRVRAGSIVAVQLNLGDLKVKSFMLVESVKHEFKESEHIMNLTVIGGDFIA